MGEEKRARIERTSLGVDSYKNENTGFSYACQSVVARDERKKKKKETKRKSTDLITYVGLPLTLTIALSWTIEFHLTVWKIGSLLVLPLWPIGSFLTLTPFSALTSEDTSIGNSTMPTSTFQVPLDTSLKS